MRASTSRPAASAARAMAIARSASNAAGCQLSNSRWVVAISAASARPAAGSSSVWRAIAQACATVASRLSSRRSAVLALPLRLPKYTVTAMPRSRVASTVSTSPMRTLTDEPASSLQLTSAWLAPGGLAAAQQLLGDGGQALQALAAVVGGTGVRCVRCSMDYPVAMRGRDEDTGEFLSPSRSQTGARRWTSWHWANTLVALSAAQLARLPIPDEVLPHIRETQRITSYRRAQAAAGVPGQADAPPGRRGAGRDPRRAGEGRRGHPPRDRRDASREALRDTLMGDDGDAAMTDLAGRAIPTPTARSCASWCATRTKNRSATSRRVRIRELFRELRELLAQAGDATTRCST